MHNAVMATITIRNVPDEVRDKLAARAALVGKSMQEYLLGEMKGLVGKMSAAEIFARADEIKKATNTAVSAESILRDIRDMRK
jgi:plasmid stability protein